jgi:hypothetical protein
MLYDEATKLKINCAEYQLIVSSLTDNQADKYPFVFDF